MHCGHTPWWSMGAPEKHYATPVPCHFLAQSQPGQAKTVAIGQTDISIAILRCSQIMSQVLKSHVLA